MSAPSQPNDLDQQSLDKLLIGIAAVALVPGIILAVTKFHVDPKIIAGLVVEVVVGIIASKMLSSRIARLRGAGATGQLQSLRKILVAFTVLSFAVLVVGFGMVWPAGYQVAAGLATWWGLEWQKRTGAAAQG